MERKVAAIVTFPDIQKWFKGEFWDSSSLDGDTFHARSSNIEALVKPSSVMFHISVKSYEDPLDSDEIVTEDPIKFLSDFLKTGTEGDEYFNVESSSIKSLVDSLHQQNLGEIIKTVKKLRRSIASLEFQSNQRTILGAIRSFIGSEIDTLEDIKKVIKKMGWKVREGKESPNGQPSLIIEISDEYEAIIEIDSILWEYNFVLKGNEATREKGFSNDPIDAYRKWLKSPKLKEAIRQRIESIENTETRP